MHRHRSVKVNFVFDHVLNYCDIGSARQRADRQRAIASLSATQCDGRFREKRTLRGHRKSVAYDPTQTLKSLSHCLRISFLMLH